MSLLPFLTRNILCFPYRTPHGPPAEPPAPPPVFLCHRRRPRRRRLLSPPCSDMRPRLVPSAPSLLFFLATMASCHHRKVRPAACFLPARLPPPELPKPPLAPDPMRLPLQAIPDPVCLPRSAARPCRPTAWMLNCSRSVAERRGSPPSPPSAGRSCTG